MNHLDVLSEERAVDAQHGIRTIVPEHGTTDETRAEYRMANFEG
jgi:hypothetical protein